MAYTTFTKIFEFSSSHVLRNPNFSDEENLKRFGKCANPSGHGHNYKLEVTLSGELDPETSMLLEASKLQKIVDKEIVSELDHKHLNIDVSWLDGLILSTETLVNQIYFRLKDKIKEEAPNCYLKRIKLWETSKIYAEVIAEN